VLNPRTDEGESVEAIVAKAEKALEFYRPDQLLLNTDCGFGCFASRSVNVEDIAFRKLCAIVEAAPVLREKSG
jgi:methionine synthase II (cobalamin-independent)